MNHEQYIQPLLTALHAAKRAGEAILEVYNSDFAVEHKDDHSPLTLADKRSHEIILNGLQQTRSTNNKEPPLNNPLLPILSEEGKDIPYNERKRWEYLWLVDPLDGTKEFIKRNGEFTVNIALIRKDKPVLGCIYIPVQDCFYFAAVNIGAYMLVNSKIVSDDLTIKKLLDASQGLPLSANTRKSALPKNQDIMEKHRALTIVGSRSHATQELSEFVDKIKETSGEVAFISAGSSLKFCLVAEGKADIYPRFGPTMEWDTAAGQAIVEQAQGWVLDIPTKGPLTYNKNTLVNPFFLASGQGFPPSQLKSLLSCPDRT
ncbi:MAG: 3'(2'),5'-bisphosphate nucleotidase CysQ [Candidatus Brocadia sp.]|nr:MAG: 3'(2'),5'-bisphosphate nucleotidase CysQ [Candidatus Brocadia sp.]